MISELTLILLGLIAALVIITELVSNKNLILGYNYRDVYQLEYTINKNFEGDERVQTELRSLLNTIEAFPGVEKLGYWHFNPPFSKQKNHPWGDLKYKGGIIKGATVDYFVAEENMSIVFRIHITEGRWFNNTDHLSKEMPVIINRKLKNQYFKDSDAIGEVIEFCGNQVKIVGVIDDFRYMGEYASPAHVLIGYQSIRENVQNPSGWCISCNGCGEHIFFFRTKTHDSSFEANLVNQLNTKYPDWTVTIQSVDKLHKDYLNRTWIPIMLISIILFYMVTNVLFGLFGLLWYNISLRQTEIGIRRSIGASRFYIYRQFIVEMLVMTTLGVIPALIIASQFSILKVFEISSKVYLIAMITATIIIYLLVTICALLPSYRASKIQPAVALHEE